VGYQTKHYKRIRTAERVISTISLYLNYLSISFSEMQSIPSILRWRMLGVLRLDRNGPMHLKWEHLVPQTLICSIGVPACVLSPEDWSKTTIVAWISSWQRKGTWQQLHIYRKEKKHLVPFTWEVSNPTFADILRSRGLSKLNPYPTCPCALDPPASAPPQHGKLQIVAKLLKDTTLAEERLACVIHKQD